jgi:23S rRNA (guanine745-N1)-methyltransferase
VLAAVTRFLACPHCGGPVERADRVLRCAAGHAFDLARQGYVTLLPPGRAAPAGDSGPMIAARERFLAAGHFADLARLVATATAVAVDRVHSGCLLEVGAGTGYHLAAALDLVPDRVGLALDSAKPAARRAARAHPRAGAVVCDAWRQLPVRAGAAAAVLDVFAPRNGAEMRRVLAPGGALVVVTPTAGHLAELVDAVGLLTVDRQKPERLAATLDPFFRRTERHQHDWPLRLDRDGVRDLIEMGPSARHLSGPGLTARLAELAEPVAVTASVQLSIYRPA